MEQIFEFRMMENEETWGFEWGIGTKDEAFAYLDLLNKKIVYPNIPDRIAWKLTALDYNPREDDDPGEESEIIVLREDLAFFNSPDRSVEKAADLPSRCPYWRFACR